MKICGIVGLKNSGKTFLINKIIKLLVEKHFKVASIKHAHHNFDIDKEGTDSYMHRESGSSQIIISSSKRWAKIIELDQKKEKTLNELIEELDKPDIVIVEGFKNEDHPKMEIIKDNVQQSEYLFPKLKNVIGIISNRKIHTSINHFKTNEIDKITEYIISQK